VKFDIKNRLDLAILISAFILVLTGAFLSFFKYFFSPETLTKLTYFLIPEFFLVSILFTIKIWRK